MENKKEIKNVEKNKLNINKEKIKQILNKFVNSIWFLILIGIILLLKTILFYENTITIREAIDKNLVLGTCAFIISFMCIIAVLPNKARGIFVIVLDVLLSILLFADHVYYIYSSSALSIAQITNLQYGEEILGTIPMLLELKHILYFLDIIVILLLMVFKVIKIEKKEKANLKVKVLRAISGIVAICLFFTI